MSDQDLIDLYVKVCIEAEKIMQETHVVSGAHWNAFRKVLGDKLLSQAEEKLVEGRKTQNGR